MRFTPRQGGIPSSHALPAGQRSAGNYICPPRSCGFTHGSERFITKGSRVARGHGTAGNMCAGPSEMPNKCRIWPYSSFRGICGTTCACFRPPRAPGGNTRVFRCNIQSRVHNLEVRAEEQEGAHMSGGGGSLTGRI